MDNPFKNEPEEVVYLAECTVKTLVLIPPACNVIFTLPSQCLRFYSFMFVEA